jgi:hypothetical protein
MSEKQQIYDGNPVFKPDVGMTPFGFYDDDKDFQSEAPKVAKFCAYRLGYPLMDVELRQESFYTAFEEAVTVYGNTIYSWKVRENYLSLEGGSTEFDANTMVVEPTLQRIIEIAKNYGTEAEVGGNIAMNTGILSLKANVQKYDLASWAESQGVEGGIEVRRVFYEAPPAILRYFDPYAGTGTGVQSLMDAFDFGSYSPGVNFLLMPISADLLKIQAIEFNDQVRKSSYSFDIVNNQLEIFPIPQIDSFLRIDYYKLSDKKKLTTQDTELFTSGSGIFVPEASGSVFTHTITHNLGVKDVSVQTYQVLTQTNASGSTITRKYPYTPASVEIIDANSVKLTFTEQITGSCNLTYPVSAGSNVITNVSEVPYENPIYSKINSIGRQWIRRYTLALCKEMLAYVRGKFTTIPVPDAPATLNQADLLTDARAEKEALLKELNDLLDTSSRKEQLNRKAEEAEALNKTLQGVPAQSQIIIG